MPPPPPGAEGILGWLVLIVIVAVALLGAAWILGHVVAPPISRASPGGEGPGNEAMRELLEEIRLLRRDIEELRRELRE